MTNTNRINRRIRVAALRQAVSDRAYVAPMSLYTEGVRDETSADYLVVNV